MTLREGGFPYSREIDCSGLICPFPLFIGGGTESFCMFGRMSLALAG